MPSALAELVKYTLLIIGALFPIVNPIGTAPLFLTLTRGISREGRAILSRMIALNGLMLILGSIFVGTHVLAFFGISLPVVQVSGGMVVLAAGWTLLRRSDDEGETSSTNQPCDESGYKKQAFYPLTLPLTVDPGAISVAITLGANHAHGVERVVIGLLAGITGTALISLCVWLAYRYAERVARWLGHTRVMIVLRLSAFIVLCIGVEITWNGIKSLATELSFAPPASSSSAEPGKKP